MTDNCYDVIIIGTGAGGGTLAYHLAPSGKRILILERGDYVPREKANTPAGCSGAHDAAGGPAMTVELGLLSDLVPEQRRAVLSRMHRRSYRSGEVVFHEGDTADTVHFVVEGRVVARRASETVTARVCRHGARAGVRRAGDDLPGGRRTATIEAVEPTMTLALGFADFERLCASHPRSTGCSSGCWRHRVTRLTGVTHGGPAHAGRAASGAEPDRAVRRLLPLGAREFDRDRVDQPDRDRRARRGDPTDRRPGAAAARGRRRRRARAWPDHRARPLALRPRAPAGRAGPRHTAPGLTTRSCHRSKVNPCTPREETPPDRKSDPSGRVIFLSSAVDEALEDAREAVGLLEVREVAGALEEHDAAPGKTSCARSA